MLRDYRRPFTGSVEIGEDSAVHTRALAGNAAHPGFATVLSPDGQFNLTHALDLADSIHTGTTSYCVGGVIYNYYYRAFAIAWRGYRLFLPLVVSNWQAQ